jgi:peptidoglycan/xylan/chitin deacetylase (PgdA/CDA1 family)
MSKNKLKTVALDAIKGIKHTSTFLFVCGIIAILYAVYRIVLIAYPINLIVHGIYDPKDQSGLVCSIESEPYLPDTLPLISEDYQNRIISQAHLSGNLITNPQISNISDISSQPVGYYHSVENSISRYQLVKDSAGRNFLRTINNADDKYSGIFPSWVLKPVNVNSDYSYSYSFQYRSDTKVNVAIEYFAKDVEEPTYVNVTTLDPSSSWHKFTAHYNPGKGSTSFRVAVYGTSAGRVDTRAFEIYRISDGDLNTGIVSIAFDAGWQSVDATAIDLLNDYGFRTTQYVISQVASENVKDYMSISSISRIKQYGHEIASHSLNNCTQTTLTYDDLLKSAVLSKHTLEEYNLGPINSFSYPSGIYDSRTQTVYAMSYSYVRANDYGYNDKYYDKSNIRSINVLSTTTRQQFDSWLNEAKENNLWLVLVYHKIDSGEESVSRDNFVDQLDSLNNSGLIVIPVGEAAQLISSN